MISGLETEQEILEILACVGCTASIDISAKAAGEGGAAKSRMAMQVVKY